MSQPNTSEKSNDLDRQENLTRGQLSVKKVALYSYDATTDTVQPGIEAFSPYSDITTVINGDVITQTDGSKTLTITINGGTITEVWT